jgi:hypothetical protein
VYSRSPRDVEPDLRDVAVGLDDLEEARTRVTRVTGCSMHRILVHANSLENPSCVSVSGERPREDLTDVSCSKIGTYLR